MSHVRHWWCVRTRPRDIDLAGPVAKPNQRSDAHRRGLTYDAALLSVEGEQGPPLQVVSFWAASRSRLERIIACVEVGAQGTNTRFIVIDLYDSAPRPLVEARGHPAKVAVEGMFCRLIAIRCEPLPSNFLAAVCIAAIVGHCSPGPGSRP